jgi:hypothetical protein
VSGLADRLVTAAADAVAKSQCERHEEREYHWHRADGVAAAAAVLRELAKGTFLLRPNTSGTAGFVTAGEIRIELDRLAGVVERGEQA